MTDSFGVVGRNILSEKSFKYKQKQPSRKIFNTDWAIPTEYKHEIGNHYRDYKNQKKIHRIRKSRFGHKKVFFNDTVCDHREVLPINRVDFPQPTLDSLRNGNQPDSRRPPLGTVYDNTIRRILAANTLTELEYLTKRQERLFKLKKGLKPTQRISINCCDYLNAASKTVCNTNRTKRHSLGHIRFDGLELTHLQHLFDVGGNNKANDKGLSGNEFSQGEISDEKDNYFLRLASECYDEGFLAHIKYLESIGERNAINNQISKRRKPRHNSENTNTTSRPQSAGSNVSSGDSVEDLSNSIGGRGFASVVKRILQNCRFGQNPCNYDESVHGVIQRNWKIRVNITRSSSPESPHSSHSSIREPHNNIGANHCIMSETLHANEEQPQQISASNNSSVKRHSFHDLIQNLNNLEISKLGSLPKIVLTDFSTSNIVVDSATSYRAKSHDNIIRKQQSLDVDIPSFSDFNSEGATPFIGVCQNMVTVEHHHQNTSASPPHQHSTSVGQQDTSITTNMSENPGQIQQQPADTVVVKNSDTVSKEAVKSAVSQRSIDLKISKKPITTQEITKKVLKLDLVSPKDLEDFPVKSPKSPVSVRMPHQTSLTSSVDVEDRKTLREALYQGIFHRHRRTIFAVGSFLRMLRSRNSQYNTIRSSSEGEDMDEVR